jgi:hypothetical protein
VELLLEPLYGLRRSHPRPTDLLRLGSELRKSWSGEQAIWLLQQLEWYWDALRLQAFASPEHLLFEGQALQMGSRWPLARRRAELLATRFPSGLLVEIGAGIGGDTLELARVRPLRACERDERRLQCLRHNLNVYGLAHRVELVHGDGLEHLHGAESLYADPARRDGGARQWRAFDPDPQLLWSRALPVCLKLAPGLDEDTLPPGVDLDYVSHQGVCKEAVLWKYPEQTGQVLGWQYAAPEWRNCRRSQPPEVGELCIGDWLHEPDPAAIRAQAWLPAEGVRIDESLALLATPPGVRSPWSAAFEVLEIADADVKNLKKLQTRYDFHPLELKKRGFDVEPEALRKKLPRGQRGGAGTIFLTRVGGRHRALVCRRVQTASSGAVEEIPPAAG